MNLLNQDCTRIDSPIYRSLCQTLSAPITVNIETRAFTGSPDTDLLILNKLSDRDLIDVCATNKYVNNLCNHPSFWMHRLIDRYGKYLGTAREIRQRYIPNGTSWKEYYLWLSGLLDNENPYIARNIANVHNRNDLKIILFPIKIKGPLLSFVRTSNFGLSDPANPASMPLRNVMSVVVNDITTRRKLILLFDIYRKYNQVAINSEQLMATGIVKPDQLTPADVTLLNDPDITARLDQEYRLYKGILELP